MPWAIVKRDKKFCVVNKETGNTVHCHADEQKAKDQMAALYVWLKKKGSAG